VLVRNEAGTSETLQHRRRFLVRQVYRGFDELAATAVAEITALETLQRIAQVTRKRADLIQIRRLVADTQRKSDRVGVQKNTVHEILPEIRRVDVVPLKLAHDVSH
jgi:hypothetical protein